MKKKNIVIFFSNGASGYKYLIDNDDRLNKNYRIVGCFTDNKNASGIQKFSGVSVLDYGDWCHKNNVTKKDMTARELYFKEIHNEFLSLLEIDLIILSGFMLKIPPSFISKYENKIINIHPADLSILDPNTGKPKYRGADAVRLAIESGEVATCSTIHFVTNELDCGEIICISDPLEVGGRTPEEQQELMKKECDGPALSRALKILFEKKNKQ